MHKAGLANLTDVVVTYDDTSKRVTVMCAKGAILKLRGDMARMFCFINNTVIRAFDKKGYLKLETTIFMLICSCSSYCDNKGKHGRYVSKNFERPHYVPLNNKIFHLISINIRDKAGDLVAFEHGKVIITLHFRCSKTQHFILSGFATGSFKFDGI